MTKATQTLALFLALAGVWLALSAGYLPTPALFREQVVPVLPWWALVSFGSYALGTLGWDLLTFKDKPEKYKELMAQIKEAKVDLKAKGVSISN